MASGYKSLVGSAFGRRQAKHAHEEQDVLLGMPKPLDEGRILVVLAAGNSQSLIRTGVMLVVPEPPHESRIPIVLSAETWPVLDKN